MTSLVSDQTTPLPSSLHPFLPPSLPPSLPSYLVFNPEFSASGLHNWNEEGKLVAGDGGEEVVFDLDGGREGGREGGKEEGVGD